MKKVIILIAFLGFFTSVFAQDNIISESQTITVKDDSLYYLTKTIIIDNGTPFPDSSILNTFLGDSLQAVDAIYKIDRSAVNKWSGAIRKAFERDNYRRQHNNTAGLFFDVTGKTLRLENQERFFNQFEGRYRISVLEASPFIVNIVQIGSGALRMEREDNQTRYVFTPMNSQFFEVIIGATTYRMHEAGTNVNGLTKYEEELKVTGTRQILITKL